MSTGLVSAFYLAAAILFILALGGLSNQEKAKRAIWYGIVGMALAVIATIFGGSGHYWLLAPMVIIGGAVGAFVARRVQMTQMPELVAGFHSLVGLAAVFIGLNADIEAHRVAEAMAAGAPLSDFSGFALTLAHKTSTELAIMRVEIFLGILIGAITFTGSIVAYGKLAGTDILEAADAAQPARDQHRGGAAVPAARHPLLHGRRHLDDGAGGADRGVHRLAPDHGDRRGGHAGRHLDAEQLLGLGGGGDRLHAVERPPDRHRRAGRLLGRDPLLHHVPGDEPELRQRHPRRLRRRDRAGDGDRGRDAGDRRRRGGGDARRRRTRSSSCRATAWRWRRRSSRWRS